MLTWLKKQWRGWLRWKQADRIGWATAGRLFGLRDRDGFRARWVIRNSNRLYRLTRGHGNPWKPYRGF